MATSKKAGQIEDIDFKEGLDDTFNDVKENTIIEATVHFIDEDTVYLEIGGKSEAKLSVTEFSTKPNINDKVEVYLRYKEGEDGAPIVSLSQARQLKEKTELMNLINEGTIVEGTVETIKKHGVYVKFGSLYGFIPVALWDIRRTEDTASIKDKKVSFVIDRISNKKGGRKQDISEDFIGNRKKALFLKNKKMKTDFFENVKEGDVRKGVVKNITDFGAFVDLGGIEGLLHIGQISWNKINKVEDVLSIGQEIEVQVLTIDHKNAKVSLSLSALQEKPWETFIAQHKIDDVIKGTVTSIKPYGAFIQLIEGVDALLHVSNLSWHSLKHPKEILRQGDVVEVLIIDIDENNEKVNVSLKHLLDNPWDNAAEKYEIGTKVKGKVKSITEYGAFVELEEGIDALIYKDEISWAETIDPRSYFTEGEIVEAEVILCDTVENKIRLGIKQLSNDPWKNIPSSFKQDGVGEFTVVELDSQKGLVVEVVKDLLVTIPFNQISSEKVDDLKEYMEANFKIGDTVNASIRTFDIKRRNIELSIRDYQKVLERKSVKEYLHNGDSTKSTIGDYLKNK